MKFEDALNDRRLPPEEDGENFELKDVIEKPENASTEELLTGVEAASERIRELERKDTLLHNRRVRLQGLYEYTAKDNLGSFKESKNKLDASLEENKKNIEGAGINNLSDVLQSRRLRATDEVRDYKKDKEALREAVGAISKAKKQLKESDFEDVQELSFRGEERKESFKKLSQKNAEITGSQKVLEGEIQEVMPELVRRAEASWDEKYTPIVKEYVSLLESNAHQKGANQEAEEKLKKLLAHLYVESVAEFGLRATEDITSRKLKIEVRPNKVPGPDDWEFRGFKEEEVTAVTSLEALKKKEVEIEEIFAQEHKKLLSEVPLNIQVKTKEGYQGLHGDEGESIAYAFMYEGKKEYEEMKRQLKVKQEELSLLKKEISTREEGLDEVMKRNPASLFDISLKKEYKLKKEKITSMHTQLDVLKEELVVMENHLQELQKKIEVNKIPLDILDTVKKIDLVNYYYVHENYGRGYDGEREKNPLQTVEDFFTVFKAKREAEIIDAQAKQKKYAEDNEFELYAKYEEKIAKARP